MNRSISQTDANTTYIRFMLFIYLLNSFKFQFNGVSSFVMRAFMKSKVMFASQSKVCLPFNVRKTAPHIPRAKLSKTSLVQFHLSFWKWLHKPDDFWVETSARRDIHRPNGKKPLAVHPTLTSSVDPDPKHKSNSCKAEICELCDFLLDIPNHPHAWWSHPQKVLGCTRHVGHDVFGHWITGNHFSLEIKPMKLWLLF